MKMKFNTLSMCIISVGYAVQQIISYLGNNKETKKSHIMRILGENNNYRLCCLYDCKCFSYEDPDLKNKCFSYVAIISGQ
jgi:hypothetical protein